MKEGSKKVLTVVLIIIGVVFLLTGMFSTLLDFWTGVILAVIAGLLAYGVYKYAGKKERAVKEKTPAKKAKAKPVKKKKR